MNSMFSMQDAIYDSESGQYMTSDGSPIPLAVWKLNEKVIAPHLNREKTFTFYSGPEEEIVLMPGDTDHIFFDLAIDLPRGLTGFMHLSSEYRDCLIFTYPMIQRSRSLSMAVKNISRHVVAIEPLTHIANMMVFQCNLSMEVVHNR